MSDMTTLKHCHKILQVPNPFGSLPTRAVFLHAMAELIDPETQTLTRSLYKPILWLSTLRELT